MQPKLKSAGGQEATDLDHHVSPEAYLQHAREHWTGAAGDRSCAGQEQVREERWTGAAADLTGLTWRKMTPAVIAFEKT